uniref:(California timema) hypothetical protein n=1 Tax=Timema californicum TaxID=61474 RepID=A0A7R9J883_TIMCA|nr:unnamed protein product [Timema californicum]
MMGANSKTPQKKRDSNQSVAGSEGKKNKNKSLLVEGTPGKKSLNGQVSTPKQFLGKQTPHDEDDDDDDEDDEDDEEEQTAKKPSFGAVKPLGGKGGVDLEDSEEEDDDDDEDDDEDEDDSKPSKKQPGKPDLKKKSSAGDDEEDDSEDELKISTPAKKQKFQDDSQGFRPRESFDFKMFVSNIPKQVTVEDIKKRFNGVCDVKDVIQLGGPNNPSPFYSVLLAVNSEEDQKVNIYALLKMF